VDRDKIDIDEAIEHLKDMELYTGNRNIECNICKFIKTELTKIKSGYYKEGVLSEEEEIKKSICKSLHYPRLNSHLTNPSKEEPDIVCTHLCSMIETCNRIAKALVGKVAKTKED
jgi:hypothetical protein